VSAPSLNIHWFNLSRIEAGRVPSRSGATPFAFAGSLPDGSVTDRQHKAHRLFVMSVLMNIRSEPTLTAGSHLRWRDRKESRGNSHGDEHAK
jgi:hypothetical protein